MKIPFRPVRRNQSGIALLIVLGFLVAALILFASFMYWVSSNANVTARNNQFLGSEYAAEGATELILANMERDFLAQCLTNASYYASLSIPQTNWPVQYVFSGTNASEMNVDVYIGPIAPVTQPLDSQFSGLFGFPTPVTVTATATPVSPVGQGGSVPATVIQNVQFASIPVFQFAIFYNINLEIDPGSVMTINGPVFSNAGIWAGTANLTFNSRVSAVGQVNISSTDPFCTGKTDGTAPPNFTLLSPAQPTSGNDALTLPIGVGNTGTNTSPTNAEAILNIPPAAYAGGSDAAYSTNGLMFNFNSCDLIISNASFGVNGYLGTNIYVTFQDAFNNPYLNKLTNNELCTISNRSAKTIFTTNSPNLPTPTTNFIRVASSFPWITNVTFYDYREQDTVQAVQIDVALLNNWLTNTAYEGYRWNQMCQSHKTHPIDSISVYNSVSGSSTLPAVRIINGQQLYGSYGLTVSTPQALYVLGNLNTTTDGTHFSTNLGDVTYTYPCAVMGDAITILSTKWADTNNASLGVGSRVPVATTINAAALEGIVQSTNSSYSGGVENFLRLLENWGNPSPALTYNGSIVVLFPSIYATNAWNGNVYGVPKRNWGFDTNFSNQGGLPPMCPQSKAIIRGQWMGQ